MLLLLLIVLLLLFFEASCTCLLRSELVLVVVHMLRLSSYQLGKRLVLLQLVDVVLVIVLVFFGDARIREGLGEGVKAGIIARQSSFLSPLALLESIDLKWKLLLLIILQHPIFNHVVLLQYNLGILLKSSLFLGSLASIEKLDLLLEDHGELAFCAGAFGVADHNHLLGVGHLDWWRCIFTAFGSLFGRATHLLRLCTRPNLLYHQLLLLLIKHHLFDPLSDPHDRLRFLKDLVLHKDGHAFKLSLTLEKLSAHRLDHGQGKEIHIDEEVFCTHHVVILLVKRALPTDQLLVFALLH